MLQILNLTDMNTTTSEGSDRRDKNIILLKERECFFYTHNLIGIKRKQVSRQSVQCLDGCGMEYHIQIKIDY